MNRYRVSLNMVTTSVEAIGTSEDEARSDALETLRQAVAADLRAENLTVVLLEDGAA